MKCNPPPPNSGIGGLHYQSAHSLLNNNPHSHTLIKAICMNFNVSDKALDLWLLCTLNVAECPLRK